MVDKQIVCLAPTWKHYKDVARFECACGRLRSHRNVDEGDRLYLIEARFLSEDEQRELDARIVRTGPAALSEIEVLQRKIDSFSSRSEAQRLLDLLWRKTQLQWFMRQRERHDFFDLWLVRRGGAGDPAPGLAKPSEGDRYNA